MMRRDRLLLAALVAVALAGGGVVAIAFGRLGPQPATDAPVIDASNADEVALGRKIYARDCAICHGANLEGQPNWRERRSDGRLPAPPHDASGHTWHHTDAQIFEIIKKGISGIVPGYESDMPAFDGILSDAEIAAVIAFIKSTWPPEIRERQEARSQAEP